MTRLSLMLYLLLVASNAMGYLGPGMVGGTITIILVFFGAIFLAIFGILYYPVKRFWQRHKKHRAVNSDDVVNNSDSKN